MSYVLGYIVGTILGIILHEIGHAIAAKLNGWPLEGFRIGRAPFIWEGMYQGVKLELSLIAISGRVFCLPDMRASKFKFIFLYSSGLFVNTLIFLIAYMSFLNSESGLFFLGLMVSQATLVVFNLFPLGSKSAIQNHDGYNICKYMTSKQTPFEIWTANLNLIYVPYAEVSDTNFEPSELMREFAKITSEKNSMPAPQFLDKRLVVLDKLQKSLSHSKTEELLMLDAIITDILLHDFEHGKSQLYDLGEKAFSLGSHSTAILQTYRSVLVESGRFDEALGYFDPQEEKSKSDFVASLNFVYRARAENGAGDRLLATQLGQDAKNLIAKIPQAPQFQSLLNRMETEFQSRGDI